MATILTTISMLLPYWWSSDSFQVGLWRAHSPSSSWILIEPETDTQEGRLMFTLQIISFISVILTDLSGLIWLITLIRYNHTTSFSSHICLLVSTILTYFCLSTMIFLVWQTTQTTIDPVHLSYSFYLTLIIILIHTMTIISITINLAKYRTNHHTIQPYQSIEKISFAFNEPIV